MRSVNVGIITLETLLDVGDKTIAKETAETDLKIQKRIKEYIKKTDTIVQSEPELSDRRG